MIFETPPPDPRKWTVMVFMGAATIEGNTPLTNAAMADLKEMAYVGSGDTLDIFVQLHQGLEAVPQRSRIPRNDSHIETSDFGFENVPNWDPRDLAGGKALETFIQWALVESGYPRRPEGHFTMLVLWGHAYDFAIGRAKTSDGAIDALDFAEFADVLTRLQQKAGGKAKLHILGFDACDLATVEMACQLQPFAHYLLGSQIGIPIPGWPYDRILDRLLKPQGRLMGPAEFGSYIVRRFCESYTAKSPVSLTLLDLDRAHELAACTQVLALMLAGAIEDSDNADWIARLFFRSQTGEGKPYVDVADLCLNLMREGGDALVTEAARSLGDFLLTPKPRLVGESISGAGRPFIVEHGRNAGETARLNGISLYAPHVAPDLDFESVRRLYQNFTFVQQTHWAELVHTLARLS
jgi:hypothetical protein